MFAPGETLKDITVQVASDLTVEPNETFRVILSNVTNGEIGTAQATVTIENDDADGPSASDDAGRRTGKEKDTDTERPPSQLQQQQQERTNDSNLDQYHTEGHVTSVERSEDGGALLITLAHGRDETLVVEFRCPPYGCPDVRPGDYPSGEGEQGGREEGGQFIAEEIEITRNGSRIR